MTTSSSLQNKSSIENGLLVFVLADMLMFTMFFIVYCFERSKNLTLYHQSQDQLNQTIGMINTLVLLASSWMLVIATKSIRNNNPRTAMLFMGSAFSCGCIFVINKVFEYSAKISDGITILTNDFFMFYYILTGIHLFHVICGIVMLFVFTIRLSNKNQPNLSYSTIEGGAVYWHMVDLLWVIMFPLIYFLT
ncbi:MAG: cytochrome c oxidase subunit 3 [Cellvibrionaceae bacterium]